ncbi:MAG: hypothetical protein ACRDPH_01970 [Marmoricola sp.]
MTRRLLGTLTHAAVTTVRNPIRSGSYAFGFAKGLTEAVVAGARTGRPGTPPEGSAPPVEPHPTPAPPPNPTPGPPTPGPPTPGPPTPEPTPEPMPDPVNPPPPQGAPGVPGEPMVTEPHATSRSSAHAGGSAEAEIDDWEEEAHAPDVEVETPVGTTGAGLATNPDTANHDLQQPGTEPLMDPATTKQVRSETDTLSRGADRARS